MKDTKNKSHKDFIYKVIKYSDNEVISKIDKLEKIATKTISSNNRKMSYLNFFI